MVTTWKQILGTEMAEDKNETANRGPDRRREAASKGDGDDNQEPFGERGSNPQLISHGRRAQSPNDLKLSDSGVRRGSCAVGLRGAATVTHGAVRCSAWLGVAVNKQNIQ